MFSGCGRRQGDVILVPTNGAQVAHVFVIFPTMLTHPGTAFMAPEASTASWGLEVALALASTVPVR